MKVEKANGERRVPGPALTRRLGGCRKAETPPGTLSLGRSAFVMLSKREMRIGADS